MSERRIRRAVCPGSFDPVTNGHVDIVVRAAALYDEVVVAVLHNPAKQGTFTIDERILFIESSVAERIADTAAAPAVAPASATAPASAAAPASAVAPDFGVVRGEAFAGRLLVDVCRDLDAAVVVKGLRGGTDFAYELPMALMNRHLTGVETVFLPGDPRFEHVSSSLVKEVCRFGGDVTGLVPDAVRDALVDRLRD